MRDYEQEILEQYHIEADNIRKVRGAVLCETKEGVFLLRESRFSDERLSVLYELGEKLARAGYLVDQMILNKEGQYQTKIEDVGMFVLKKWFYARECDMRREYELKEAVKHLAKLHGSMQMEPAEKFAMEDLEEEYTRHNRELKKVRSYIRGKVQKNEFEMAFLKYFEEMFAKADETLEYLKGSGYQKLRKESLNKACVLHGDYNYHNILMVGQEMAVVNMEHFRQGIQIEDLYYFLRKAMEKYHWDARLGDGMIQAYQSVKSISKEEMAYLAIRLSYPEKFWKVANSYYRSNKVRIPAKGMEKLQREIAQTKEKRDFLHNIFAFHL